MRFNVWVFILVGSFLNACTAPAGNKQELETSVTKSSPLIGTWKLVSGTTIKGKDTVVTDYTIGQEMIKIISPTHFSFLRHDLNKGKDSLASYAAGGGRVRIGDSTYTEYLDYFNIREWEGGEFVLAYTIAGDTLTTTGVEKVEALGVDHINIEKLVRVK
ncbi:hypothetical protein [Flavihumibacter sp. CACIAM 22H1]|uniref:hypothetical protein n=1 Tax=Flavihumibacter sp. CACIAM 22H1 TaxID=1812911 RepID=UPI0007A92FCA|nr:hypothetical protein [Flavihumibacter sp. CACIAM 22H1]KYP14510.1 MAG: hypothetical protein A1D16_15405 [Flavihumibacter sp. CACIAM 22H1]